MSILIVEDNPVNAKLLVLMLHAGGYQTVVAGNGKVALRVASDTPGIQLIITDYMMPEMDGLEFILKVRTLPTFRHIPILLASAYADLETVKRAQRLQCDGFLVKPIDKEQLLKRVGYFMRSQPLRPQPLVLGGKQSTMDRLNIGLAEYHELINMFAAQLAETIPIVVLEREDSEEPISEHLGRLLKELAESAATLGADKFLLAYSKSMGLGLPARLHCLSWLKVLQELERSLPAYRQSHPNAVAKN